MVCVITNKKHSGTCSVVCGIALDSEMIVRGNRMPLEFSHILLLPMGHRLFELNIVRLLCFLLMTNFQEPFPYNKLS